MTSPVILSIVGAEIIVMRRLGFRHLGFSASTERALTVANRSHAPRLQSLCNPCFKRSSPKLAACLSQPIQLNDASHG